MSKNNCLEISYFGKNSEIQEIGIDEAGKGPMFGRVYSAAVILPKENFDFTLLKDSKKFTSKKKIMEVYNYIKSNSINYSICYEDENIIDNINIKNATFKSMHNCIDGVIKDNENFKNYYILVDGNIFNGYTKYNNNTDILNTVDHITIEKGDNKYCSIAAASILAKVERDNYIYDICNKYPKLIEYYDLKNNKGYGTSKHIAGIKNYGISPWHRKSYGICKISNDNTSEFYI